MQYNNATVSAVTRALKVQPIPPITAFSVHQIKHRTATRLQYDCSRNAVGTQSEKRNRGLHLCWSGSAIIVLTWLHLGLHSRCVHCAFVHAGKSSIYTKRYGERILPCRTPLLTPKPSDKESLEWRITESLLLSTPILLYLLHSCQVSRLWRDSPAFV